MRAPTRTTHGIFRPRIGEIGINSQPMAEWFFKTELRRIVVGNAVELAGSRAARADADA